MRRRRPSDKLTGGPNGVVCKAAASANATSANASGPLLCQTMVRRTGWRSPKARPNTTKMMRCTRSAAITAISSTATPESQSGVQYSASRTEDKIDAIVAMRVTPVASRQDMRLQRACNRPSGLDFGRPRWHQRAAYPVHGESR
jgi:hypothetical protein